MVSRLFWIELEIKKLRLNNPSCLLLGESVICWGQGWHTLGGGQLRPGSFSSLCSCCAHFCNFPAPGLCKYVSPVASQCETRQSWAPILDESESTKGSHVLCIARLPPVALAAWLLMAIFNRPQIERPLFPIFQRKKIQISPGYLCQSRVFSTHKHFGKHFGRMFRLATMFVNVLVHLTRDKFCIFIMYLVYIRWFIDMI